MDHILEVKKEMAMNDEKIVITTEECDNATPVPSCATYSLPPITGREDEDGATSPRSSKGIIIAALVTAFVFIAIGMASYCAMQKRMSPSGANLMGEQQTIDRFRDCFVQKTNDELADSQSNLRKYIEDAHLTVAVTKAYVKQCKVSTVDGSNLVGCDGSNVDEIELEIRFFWDGVIQKDGHTDLRIVLDYRANKVLSAEFLDSNALLNTEDPEFWIGLGALLFL